MLSSALSCMRRASTRWGFITTLLLSCSVATSRAVKGLATSRRLVTFIGHSPLAARRPLPGASSSSGAPSPASSSTGPVRSFASRSLLLAMATAATSSGSVAGSSEGGKRLRTLETLNFDNAALRYGQPNKPTHVDRTQAA